MSELQTASILLALSGNRGESVPKYGVTAAEVAVLRRIHGDAAVYDIDINGSVTRTHRQEIGRLTEMYGRQDGERRTAPAVAELYPGAAARVFETFDELEIPEEFYIAKTRKTARDPLDHDNDGRKGGSLPDKTGVDDELDNMTVNELRAHADKHDVDLTGVTKKADIIDAIKTHQVASEPADDDADDEVGDIDDEVGKSASRDNMFE